MTNTPTPVVLPKHGDAIVFSDRRFVGLGLIKNGKTYRVEHLMHHKHRYLRFIWDGGKSVDWDASCMRGTQWEVVQA